MNGKVIIASDSTTDLGDALIEQYKIKILPLGVTLGGKQYVDGVDIDPDFIYSHYEKTNELPKTSAVNVSDCREFFAQHTQDGRAMIFFTISAEMSSTYNNACLAAQEFDNVHVVNTGNLSTGGGLLVLSACRMAEQGKSVQEIVKTCSVLAQNVDASFVIDDLAFLHKSGRCSALTAMGANVLQIKPSIIVRNGKMTVGKKYRGRFSSALRKYIQDQIGDGSNIAPGPVFVTHAGCSEEIVNQCVEQVKTLLPDREVLLTRAGCTVSSHCGRDTLGVLFIRKENVG